MDRISNLSNEIICHIVSFLSAKEATVASVLSKRWQNLYTIIPNLEFDNTLENQGSLKDFLNGLLALPASSRIKNVSIKRRGRVGPNRHADLNSFLCNVLKRGVLKLKLDIWVTLDGVYSLPVEIFTCKTLVELELGSILQIDLVPENALLPALKTLIIDAVQFSDQSGCAFQKLLSSCPVLVELRLLNVQWEHWQWSRRVSSPTLEKLTMNHRYYFGNIYYDMEGITFDTPSLTTLKYYDLPPKSYPMVNLDSLVEATINLTLPLCHAWIRQYARRGDTVPSVTNLIKGLRNVETLNLTSTDTVDAFYFSHEAIPVFENLHHLSIATERNLCWRTLPYLLKKSPNLKTLVIEGPLHYNYQLGDSYESEEIYSNDDDDEDESESDDDESICECLSEYSFLESCLVKTVEITEYSGTKIELKHMKHFLEKLSCLELVKVCSHERDEEEQVKLRTNLLNLPRSSKCKIQFELIPPRSLV
ncbi:FBD domain [Arabidopsis suecica]|uniref:FBD domain n=1 Tax=Arabidopsis suecica TaxID=45249 RepID=A0A8T2A0R6_ARASU|nr:FBD domain [Arabidopsis suecica]